MGFHAFFPHLLIPSPPRSLILSPTLFSSHLSWPSYPEHFPRFHSQAVVMSFSLPGAKLITKTSKQVERWAECSAINKGAIVDWCGGRGCMHTNIHGTHTHTGSQRSIWTRQWGDGISVNWWLLTLTNKQESLKVGLHLLWPQFLISSANTHTHTDTSTFVTVLLFHTFTHTHTLTWSY